MIFIYATSLRQTLTIDGIEPFSSFLVTLAGYVPAPGMPPMVAPPGAPSLPGQINGVPRPPTLAPLTTVPGTATTPTSSNAAPTMVTPASYQTNPAAPTGGGFDNFNANAQPSEANH